MNRETMTTSNVLTQVTIKSMMNFCWTTCHHIPEGSTLQRRCSFDQTQQSCVLKRLKNVNIQSHNFTRLLGEHNLLEKIVTNHIL
jgi:hypothetical protein